MIAPDPILYGFARMFQMLIANIDYNDYIGRMATGRIFNGKVKAPNFHWLSSLIDDLDDDHGDVVSSTGLVGQAD